MTLSLSFPPAFPPSPARHTWLAEMVDSIIAKLATMGGIALLSRATQFRQDGGIEFCSFPPKAYPWRILAEMVAKMGSLNSVTLAGMQGPE